MSLADEETAVTRRDALRRGAIAVGSVVTAGALSGGVSAEATTIDDAQPSHVSMEYDHAWLRRYRPAFVSNYQTMQRSNGVWAAKATSSQYEYDVAVYWHRLTHQDGATLGPLNLTADSHLYDHEPCYVFVDDEGIPQEMTYTFYHHFADTVTGPPLRDAMTAHQTEDPTHIQLRIVDPWHHYKVVPDASETSMVLDYDFHDFTETVETWRSNEIFASTADESIFDPGVMRTRSSWWDESTMDYRFARLYYQLGSWIDIGGSDDAFERYP